MGGSGWYASDLQDNTEDTVELFLLFNICPVLLSSSLLSWAGQLYTALQVLFLSPVLVTRLDRPGSTRVKHFYHKATSSSAEINTAIAL